MNKWRKLPKHLLSFIKTLIIFLWSNLALRGVRLLGQFWRYLWQQLNHSRKLAIALLILTIALVVYLIGIMPWSQAFEGTLTVRSLSFTNLQSDRLFLKDINDLQRISIQGHQKFTLSGQFQSLDPQLNQLEQPEIELTDDNGSLEIAAPKDFNLLELRLQKDTIINELRYEAFKHELSFNLKAQCDNNKCDRPTILFNGHPLLKISIFGQHKLNSVIRLTPSKFNLNTTEFQLQPLPSAELKITLTLPKAPNQRVFWGSLDVKDVNFLDVLQTGSNNRDTILDSTIIAGNLLMAKQELKLTEDQFLLTAHRTKTSYTPDIKSLDRLKIMQPDQKLELKTSGENLKLTEPPQGLEVHISGHTDLLQAGLNPQLPVNKLQGSFLSRYLSNDAITAIFSLAGAVIGTLIALLFAK